MEEKLDEQLKKRGIGIPHMLGFCAAVFWIVFGFMLVIRLTAGDGGYLGAQMLEHAPPETTGLPEAEYPGMGRMIADYLTGKKETFQYAYTDERGKTRECFHSYEADHMKDCRKLVQSAGAAAVAGAFTSLFLVGMSFIASEKDPRKFFRGIIWGIRAVLAVAALLLIWAAVNFDGLFVTFHRIAFDNDGWLLNPATDMLIRLMPTEFFISLGVRGIWLALAAPALLEIVARFGLRKLSAISDQRRVISDRNKQGETENDF